MRQGQPKRLRGRNRGGTGGGGGSGGAGGGGGKGPNTVNRSYESNGPDVKIRGTAGTIADKYVQLSRDASTSGDPVAAENYMQHAEHYYRLLAAAQAQFQPHQTFVRADADDFNDGDEDDDGGPVEAAYAPPQQPNNGAQPSYAGPAPYRQNGNGARPNGQPGGYSNGSPREDGQPRRFDRNDRRDRQDRGPQDRGPQDRGPQDRAPQPDRADRPERSERAPYAAAPERQDRPDRAERVEDVAGIGLPAFITGGAQATPSAPAEDVASRRASAPAAVEQTPPIETESLAPVEAASAESDIPIDDEGPRPAARGRRRRYGRLGRAGGAGEDGEAPAADAAPPPADTPTD